jgi:hypothetical protein
MDPARTGFRRALRRRLDPALASFRLGPHRHLHRRVCASAAAWGAGLCASPGRRRLLTRENRESGEYIRSV